LYNFDSFVIVFYGMHSWLKVSQKQKAD